MVVFTPFVHWSVKGKIFWSSRPLRLLPDIFIMQCFVVVLSVRSSILDFFKAAPLGVLLYIMPSLALVQVVAALWGVGLLCGFFIRYFVVVFWGERLFGFIKVL